MAVDYLDSLPRLKRLGKQRKFYNPEHFDSLVDAYILKCRDLAAPPTVTGLALWLGYSSKGAFLNFTDRAPEFADSIDRAMTLIESYHEYAMSIGENVPGAKFLLEALHGYRAEADKQGQTLTVILDSKDSQL